MLSKQNSSASGEMKLHALIMLVAVPVSVSLALIIYIAFGGDRGEFIKKQILNCYTSPEALLVTVGLTILLFAFSSRVGAHPLTIVARNRLTFGLYLGLMVGLGLFALRPAILLGRFIYLSFSQRLLLALTNFAIVVGVASVYLLLAPMWKQLSLDSRRRALLVFCLILWGYVLASFVRMLPLPYITGVE